MSLWKFIFGASWGTSTIGYVFAIALLAVEITNSVRHQRDVNPIAVATAFGFATLGRSARQTNVSSEQTKEHRRRK